MSLVSNKTFMFCFWFDAEQRLCICEPGLHCTNIYSVYNIICVANIFQHGEGLVMLFKIAFLYGVLSRF